MDEYLKIAANYGFGGIIGLAMGWFLMFVIKMHREERKELTDALKKQHEEAMTAINNNTSVLSEFRMRNSHK
jgi:hypothetical protein